MRAKTTFNSVQILGVELVPQNLKQERAFMFLRRDVDSFVLDCELSTELSGSQRFNHGYLMGQLAVMVNSDAIDYGQYQLISDKLRGILFPDRSRVE